ncbi:MAG: deoxyribose-phosphate aldolase [Chloroflexi bacterium]|nr:deoxyribose-phosphate aldolase [Chloroflexota bacterium]
MSTGNDMDSPPPTAVTWTPQAVAARIQHTLIATGTTRDQLVAHCQECLEYGFDAAMIAGSWLPEARAVLAGSRVKLAAAIDFPLNQMTTAGKAAEARALVEAGAHEIDMLVNIGWLKSDMETQFRDDITAVVQAAKPAAIKVMLELPMLTPEQQERAVALSVEAGVAWVKNASSGAVETASPASIRFLRERVPVEIGVKASGGIKSWDQVVSLLDAGAGLWGSSAGGAIVRRETGARSY